jgi:hypothetical protein
MLAFVRLTILWGADIGLWRRDIICMENQQVLCHGQQGFWPPPPKKTTDHH